MAKELFRSSGAISALPARFFSSLNQIAIQGDTEEFGKPPVDLVLTFLAAGGPLLLLPTAQAG